MEFPDDADLWGAGSGGEIERHSCGRKRRSRRRPRKGWGQHQANGVNVMMRKMTMVLAAAAIIAAGAVSAVEARGGHGFGGHAFSGGHPGMAAAPFHAAPFHGRHFHHRRFGAFSVYGDGYDTCYARVWTRWGWRWQYVCY
jgi:hypothetical protein